MIDIDFYFNSWESIADSAFIEQLENVLGIKFEASDAKYLESRIIHTNLGLEIDHPDVGEEGLPRDKFKYRINVDSRNPLTMSATLALLSCIISILFKLGLAKEGLLVYDCELNIQEWSFENKDEVFDTVYKQTLNFDEYLTELISKCGKGGIS